MEIDRIKMEERMNFTRENYLHAVHVGEAEVGKDLRIFLTGVAVIAANQDRRAFRRGLDHGVKIRHRNVARGFDMTAMERIGVANVERDRLAPREESPRLLDSNAPERR